MEDKKVFIFQRLLCIKMWPLLLHKENFKTKSATSKKKPHVQWSKRPRRTGALPINHRQCPDGASAGGMAMLWEGKAVSQAPLLAWLITDTQSAAFLCERLLSSGLFPFTFSFLLSSLQDPAFWPSQQIFWPEEGKPTQTDLLNISCPARCQANI